MLKGVWYWHLSREHLAIVARPGGFSGVMMTWNDYGSSWSVTFIFLKYLLKSIFDFSLHLPQQVQFLCAPPLSSQTCQGAVLWLL